jgi:DNA (cytosine-5)-methyltransferase 1
MTLLCIDLFSGIGGMSLALKDFVKTVTYCEIEPFCQQVLTERMEDKSIDRATIHGNVRTLHLSDVIKPDIIIGGFPCQDVSSIGLQKGIADGERSGLFYEIMRLVDECPSVRYVFLENVSNILHCGLQEVLEEFGKRDFELQWLIKSAGSLGAPHVRSRWFCLATRKNTDALATEVAESTHSPFAWSVEPDARVTFKPHAKEDPSYDDNWIQRCQCLGNTVVPTVVRSAFIDLMKIKKNSSQLWDCLEQFSVPVASMSYPYPESGLVMNGRCLELPKVKSTGPSHHVPIQVELNGKVVTMQSFPTPRRGITHASAMTERSIRDLPTILVNSTIAKEYIRQGIPDIKDEDMHGSVIANVNYIEWLMGFPANWTKSKVYTKKSSSHRAHQEKQDKQQDIEEPMVIGDEAEPSSIPLPVKTPRTVKVNGMHLFMKENPGKDIVAITTMWKALPQEERTTFSQKAKQMNS